MSTGSDHLTYVQLWDEPDDRRIALCRAFYERVYRGAFPKPEQAEDPETWLPLMSPDAPPGKPHLHMIVACAPASGDTVVGGIIFEHYRRSGFWLATYIAVHSGLRGHGVATELFARMKSAIVARAPSKLWQLLAEAENPLRLRGEERIAGYRRLSFLTRLGLRRLPIDYIQPPLAPGKPPGRGLLLLCAARPDAPGPSADDVAGFLGEFYDALDQPDAPELEQMLRFLAKSPDTAPIPLDVPARYDGTVGHADALTLRMTFVSRHLQASAGRGHDAPHGGEIPLDGLRPRPEDPPELRAAWHLLSDSFSSFHADIIIPFASANSLPAVLQCEPFRHASSKQRGTREPLAVRISFPSALKMEWEGKVRSLTFFHATDSPWEVHADLVDSVAVFESGYLIYSVALVFRPDHGSRVPINVAAILTLASVAEPAGRLIGKPVRISSDGSAPLPFHNFLPRRLNTLAAAADAGQTTVFSVFANAPDPAVRITLRDALLGMTFPDPTSSQAAANTRASLSLEIIGADHHADALRAARESQERSTPITPFTLRLAGLSQNVLDFEEQDESEVHDSLARGAILGSELTFAHRDLTMRFSRSSRAFSEMWAIIGGEPYWFLVEMIISHNARLLADLNEDVRRDQGTRGLTGLMMGLLARPASLSSQQDRADAQRRLRRTQERRIRLAHYMPNLFRYPTEQALYEQFVEAKGLVLQREYFLGLEDTIEKLMRDIATLETGIAEADDRAADAVRRASDERRDRLLVAIGVVQTTGVFAAFASVFAAFGALSGGGSEGLAEVGKELKLGWFSTHLPGLDASAWPWVLALGLTAASLNFVGAVALLHFARRVAWHVVLRIVAIALLIPVVLAVAVWALAVTPGVHAVVVLLFIGLAAGATPGILYMRWARSERGAPDGAAGAR